MRRFTILLIIMTLLMTATIVAAQPTLESLWPNSDGLRFDYLYNMTDLMAGENASGPAYLVLEGYTTTPGGQAQNLIGEHPLLWAKKDEAIPALPSPLAIVWRARPDLREEIETRYAMGSKPGYWAPYFLHTGYFMKTPDIIEMWQDDWSHSTWTYLSGEPVVGASFTHQLVPELADDIFLHGEVTDINATVVTENDVYENAVKVAYFVDLGIGTVTDENGNLLYTFHAEMRGHVHFVPDVGPVEMLEEYTPFVWADCGEDPCPEEISDWLGLVAQTQTLSLLQDPVSTEDVTWGAVKTIYR